MTACKTVLLVSLLAKQQELPVFQLAMHVDPFHLVITDKWRPAQLNMMGILKKPPTHFSRAVAL
jgi:hypothetical protein